MKNILIIIAPEGYQDVEYGDPKQIFLENGYRVTTASTEQEAHGKFGGITKVDVLLQDINPENYDAIVFIGGPGTPLYFSNQIALSLASSFAESGKITAAICAAPGILANAGILANKKATSHPAVEDIVRPRCATYTGEDVTQDGKIITANGPAAAKNFAKVIVKNL